MEKQKMAQMMEQMLARMEASMQANRKIYIARTPWKAVSLLL
jgi:hypothetical protein